MNHYSQNDEQEFILNFFSGRTGNLLDIGAFDGVTFSNSRALLECGWSGVLVEPDPFNLSKLLASCQTLGCPESVIVICSAVSECTEFAPMSVEQYLDRGWASTIDPALMRPGRVLKPHPSKVIVSTISMGFIDVLRKECDRGPFSFINIDAEGMDFRILQDTPPDILEACELLCIEPHDLEQRTKMKVHLNNRGFKTVHETPENLLVCHA